MSAIVVECYLETQFFEAFKQAGVNAPANNLFYTITNPTIIANIVDIQDSSVNNALLKRPMEISAEDFTVTINSIPPFSNNASLSISDKSQCLNALITCFKGNGTATASGLSSYKYNLTSFNYKINGLQYPVAGVNVSNTNLVEAWAEQNKVFNSALNSIRNTTMADSFSFKNDGVGIGIPAVAGVAYNAGPPVIMPVAPANAVNSNQLAGCYCSCVDLESFSDASTSLDGVGLNTSRMNTNITFNCVFNGAANPAITALTFARKTAVYIISSGEIQVSI